MVLLRGNLSKPRSLLAGKLLWLSFLFLLAGCMTSRPESLGVSNGTLTPCPATPNCVSSQSSPADTEHFISAMPYAIPEELLRQNILEVLNETPRTKIVTASNDCIHVESTSLFLRFTDDFEFYIDSREKLLHFRSASRVGRSDFGTNRKRVEAFKKELLTTLTELNSPVTDNE